MKTCKILFLGLVMLTAGMKAQIASPMHNPVFKGWYADPEAAVIGNRYWIFPTSSLPYDDQVCFDAFSSTDLINWEKHARVLDTAAIKWVKRALWAPALVEKENKYFLFFSANDIQSNNEYGGIGIAISERPEGPFKDYLGKPLIGRFYNGAQPIDQFIFKDTDGQYYIIYGGWRHCNIARLNNDFTGLTDFEDGNLVKEITPEGYVEGPVMFVRNGKYYFMWSEGDWTGPDYCVAYAIADSPFGPFTRIGKVLEQDPEIATGAGHHSVIQVPGKDQWYIVYHRRPKGDTNPNHRETCIEIMEFEQSGLIRPVKITQTGLKK
jgi:beta-xylosidase